MTTSTDSQFTRSTSPNSTNRSNTPRTTASEPPTDYVSGTPAVNTSYGVTLPSVTVTIPLGNNPSGGDTPSPVTTVASLTTSAGRARPDLSTDIPRYTELANNHQNRFECCKELIESKPDLDDPLRKCPLVMAQFEESDTLFREMCSELLVLVWSIGMRLFYILL